MPPRSRLHMYLSRLISPCIVLILGVSLTPHLAAQQGAMTVQRNLAQLAGRADVIFRGRVLEVKSEPHPELRNLDTIVITLHVDEVLKGSPPPLFTFRQFVWDIRDRVNTAGYRKGQHLLLLMNKPSRLGLTSPTGLEQGRFKIRTDATGATLAVNGRGNVGLFTNVPEQLQTRKVRLSAGTSKMIRNSRGPVRTEELAELIRALVGKK
jgi:hypothetical protein